MLRADEYQRRFRSVRSRIEALTSLRAMVALPAKHDILPRQWRLIEAELNAVASRLTGRLKRTSRGQLQQIENWAGRRALNALLGELELELAQSFTLFDTYMDILTQRHIPELGRLLAGCDVLARAALRRDHVALAIVEPALVYCDRGFGASTLREGVRLPNGARNPTPLIQIPYARLKEKFNLTSVVHEVGHEGAERLGLVKALPLAIRRALASEGAPATIQDLYALWSFEIGPDFWTFCSCGLAEAATVREILALPPQQALHISLTDPHPPPYLRVLLAFEWCRQTWGNGMWDGWEREWRTLYQLTNLPPGTGDLLIQSRTYLPAVARALLRTRFAVLGDRTIPDLFDLDQLAPWRLRERAKTIETGTLQLGALSPCGHLAVFRMLREDKRLTDQELDRVMTTWLMRLAEAYRTKSLDV